MDPANSNDPWFSPTSPENEAAIAESKRNAAVVELASKEDAEHFRQMYGYAIIRPEIVKTECRNTQITRFAPAPLEIPKWRKWELKLYELLGITNAGKAD